MLEVEGGSRVAAPKGVNDLCFHTYGEFSPPSPRTRIWVLRLGFGSPGWDLGLKAGIWASRMGFGSLG